VNLVDVLLRRFEDEQARIAREALQQPQTPAEFAYGRAVGMHAGLEHAKNLLLELVDEKNKRDFIL
jgi:hypothetical protein